MISEKMQDALNKQLNAELYAAYLYFSMTAYFENLNLPGFAKWMRIQTQEEMTHAFRFYHHIIERGGRAKMAAIQGPPIEWASPLAAFQDAYNHEIKVTGMINNLVDIAQSERDHAANAMLQWFITEQVEEEKNADDNVRKLKLAENHPQALFMLDREMAARAFTMPPDLALQLQ